ncbi:outer membrane lipid asymmetry maintenance protein MlaD [Desulfatitalea tepidiphila]|uniref:outer membrane lipid asymmetry maintenance protein MlaD n=1 Tax=Desulfatitalea tepidiphila TaxID=1185843 RepID=UPI0006B636EF|nr:outer membrane lipid asymmetry maintenance protein MlaD [Desulfatitalea tepidiphila]
MKKGSVEMAVGIFVLIGMLCAAYLAIKLGRMEWFGEETYQVQAYFNSVSGLKKGAVVEMAGVEVGQVHGIMLDAEHQMAVVTLDIRNGVQLSTDVIASVKTSGLIGDKYIRLSSGGATDVLKAGDTIMDTESALDIEELIGQYVFGKVKD